VSLHSGQQPSREIYDPQAIQAGLERLSARIGQHLATFLPDEVSASDVERYAGPPTWKYEPQAFAFGVVRPYRDMILRQGKRWRPMIGILMVEALGQPAPAYEQLISVMMECIHTGALMVDDVEDHSLRRRGDTAIHIRYGLDVAINAGNSLYFLPLTLLRDHPRLTDTQKLELYYVFTQVFVRAHVGQATDIYWSHHTTSDNIDRWMGERVGRKILQAYQGKTAAAVEGCAEAAAVIAGADAPTRQACIRFAKTFGVSFQILDDVNNFSSSPDWTKVCGEDLGQGKLTYVIYRALERLTGPMKRRLQEILCQERLRRDPEILREGIRLIHASRALDQCRCEANAFFCRSWEHFDRVLQASPAKLMLFELCRRLLTGDKDLRTT